MHGLEGFLAILTIGALGGAIASFIGAALIQFYFSLPRASGYASRRRFVRRFSGARLAAVSGALAIFFLSLFATLSVVYPGLVADMRPGAGVIQYDIAANRRTINRLETNVEKLESTVATQSDLADLRKELAVARDDFGEVARSIETLSGVIAKGMKDNAEKWDGFIDTQRVLSMVAVFQIAREAGDKRSFLDFVGETAVAEGTKRVMNGVFDYLSSWTDDDAASEDPALEATRALTSAVTDLSSLLKKLDPAATVVASRIAGSIDDSASAAKSGMEDIATAVSKLGDGVESPTGCPAGFLSSGGLNVLVHLARTSMSKDRFFAEASSEYAKRTGGACGSLSREAMDDIWEAFRREAPHPSTDQPIALVLHFASSAFDAAMHDPEIEAFANSLEARAATQRCLVEIVGHTDSVGSDEDNIQLATRRANSARDRLNMFLRDASISVEVVPRGERNLATYTGDGAARPENRRVALTATCKPRA